MPRFAKVLRSMEFLSHAQKTASSEFSESPYRVAQLVSVQPRLSVQDCSAWGLCKAMSLRSNAVFFESSAIRIAWRLFGHRLSHRRRGQRERGLVRCRTDTGHPGAE